MKRDKLLWAAVDIAASLLLLAAACAPRPSGGPPAIQYGQDACARCGMILSDERFAAALIPSASDAAPLLFDDIGCMLAYERAGAAPPAQRYVHDVDSRRWIDADRAYFIRTPRHTPMGSGLVAMEKAPRAGDPAPQEAAAPAVAHPYTQLLQNPPAPPALH